MILMVAFQEQPRCPAFPATTIKLSVNHLHKPSRLIGHQSKPLTRATCTGWFCNFLRLATPGAPQPSRSSQETPAGGLTARKGFAPAALTYRSSAPIAEESWRSLEAGVTPPPWSAW